MPYSIRLPECHRVILARALRAAFAADPTMFADVEGQAGETDEAGVLLALLDDLPSDEAESPGAIHGFAL